MEGVRSVVVPGALVFLGGWVEMNWLDIKIVRGGHADVDWCITW